MLSDAVKATATYRSAVEIVSAYNSPASQSLNEYEITEVMYAVEGHPRMYHCESETMRELITFAQGWQACKKKMNEAYLASVGEES